LAQRDQAAAQLRQAEAQLANLQKGRRPDEIAALQAALSQARANRTLADAEFKRAVDLKQRGFVSQAALDTRRAQRDAATMQASQAESNLALAGKGARSDEVGAARANAEAAKAALGRAEYALSQRRIKARVAGRVEDTLRRAGEYVPPGAAEREAAVLRARAAQGKGKCRDGCRCCLRWLRGELKSPRFVPGVRGRIYTAHHL
jgi:HlyD family secretion protein